MSRRRPTRPRESSGGLTLPPFCVTPSGGLATCAGRCRTERMASRRKSGLTKVALVLSACLSVALSYSRFCPAVLYARSGAQFQAKYLSSGARLLAVSNGAASSSSLRLPSAQSHESTTPSDYFRVPSPGAASFQSVASTVRPPIPLVGTDPLFFRNCLEFLYTGDTSMSSVFTFLFEDGLASNTKEDATAKLAEVR
jgi:hypothetical protein